MPNFNKTSKVAAAAVAAFFLCYCGKDAAVTDVTVTEIPEDTPLRLPTRVTLTEGCLSADIFIYCNDGALGRLEDHFHLDSVPGTVTLDLLEGEKTVMCVSDIHGTFHPEALASVEALETLRFRKCDDGGSIPVRSGSAICKAGGECTLRMDPLRSTVVLHSVANNLGGYTLLEDPEAFLTNSNSAAELFRAAGFFPNETLDTTSRASLPCDVGYFTQFPDLELLCYPDESASTRLVFACRIEGEPCQWTVPLPAIRRNTRLTVELEINGPHSLSSHIY